MSSVQPEPKPPGVVARAGERTRDCLLWLEGKPLAVIAVAGAASLAAAFLLASSAGWDHVLHLLRAPHSWAWLGVCFAAELIAYGGYVLTIRDVARVDSGPGMTLRAATRTVVAGFGVFAATRASGGFAVDYWAFRRVGAEKRDAVVRVLALGFLELATLGTVVLAASFLLDARLDGHAGAWITLPPLSILPIFAVVVWLTSHKRAERLSSVRPGSGWVRRTFADAVAGARTMRSLVTRPHLHGLGVLGMVVYWVGDIACLWAALQLTGVDEVTFALLVLAYAGCYVLSRRSLPAGGAGFVEVALTFALVGMGAPFTPALLGVLIYRLFNFWVPILPALVFIPRISEARLEFQRAAEISSK